MILDKTLTFLEDPTVVAAGLLGDVVDLKRASNAQFQGNPIYVGLTIAADITGDLKVDVMTHSAAAVGSGYVIGSIEVLNADAKAGTTHRIAISSANAARYVGIVGVTGSVGTITAGLALDVDSFNKDFPDAIN